MKKDKDAFIKVLIVLVIASLSLLAIVYVMQSNRDNGGNFTNPFRKTEKIELQEKKEVSLKDSFDNKGRLVINKDIDHDDEGWLEKCEGSEWYLGEEKVDWFYNEKYGYKLKYQYNNEIYNDDLIEVPYTLADDQALFSLPPRLKGNEKTGYSYACDPMGSNPFISLKVEEIKTVENILAEARSIMVYFPEFNLNFKEFKIDDFFAVSYKVISFASDDPQFASDDTHIILLGDEYNYHFSTNHGSHVLLEMIDGFILVK